MNIGSVFKQSRWSMKRKLFIYMMMHAVLLIFVLISASFLFGRFDSEEKNTFEEFDIQMEFFEKNVFTHFDRLAGGGIQLSKDISYIIEQQLNQWDISFSEISNQNDAIEGLQSILLEPLHQHLLQENCSGAFIMLSATVNRSLPDDDYSRAGLYIQRPCFYNSDETVVLFRGDAAISKAYGILPHTKWRLEIQTDMIPGYDQIISNAALPLQDAYLFTDVFNLPGTSDNVMLLVLPMFGSDGTFYGLCGYEVSENYFMTYHAQPTKIPNLTCLVVPGISEHLDSAAALSCGGSNGYYRAPSGILTASNMNGGLKSFSSDDVSYVGLTQSLSLSPNNPDYTLAVMMLKSDYDKVINKNALQNLFLWAFVIFFAVTSCLYFSKRFLSPILKALEQVKNPEIPKRSDVLEMDDLFHFLSQKDREQERTVHTLEQRWLAALHEKENLRREYEAAQSRYETAQSSYEAAQQEVSRLAYSRTQEIDPDDYAQFLSGISTLTPTERKVFNLYLEGKSVKEILEVSDFKESTLRFHNRNIYGKLGVNSLKQLLRFATLMQQDQERGAKI